MAYENVSSPVNFQRQVLGQKGFRTLRGAATSTSGEHYRAITVLDAAVITTVSESGDNLSAASVPAGITIYGLFSSVELASGSVLAYIA